MQESETKLSKGRHNRTVTLPVIVIGGGGHARVLIDAMRRLSMVILGITDADPKKAVRCVLDVPVIGNDEILRQHPPESVKLVNGVGATRSTEQRKRIFMEFKKKGYLFAGVIHPSAIIASGVRLFEGVQIMAGAVIQTGSILKENSIVNTGGIIDHDCTIGAHVHLAPGVTLSGGVEIGDGACIGTSAAVIQNVKIGSSALVAAGAVVVSDIPAKAVARGVPAKVF